jgi:hydroxymethylpyrimidine pyrophosphatase-like HAD family hydrolase
MAIATEKSGIIPPHLLMLLTDRQRARAIKQIAEWNSPKYIGFDGAYIYFRIEPLKPMTDYSHIVAAIAPSGKMTTMGAHH